MGMDESRPLTSEQAQSENERCKCYGYDLLMGHGGLQPNACDPRNDGCKCNRKLTGEDLKCDICREWCWDGSTPRYISPGALENARKIDV